MAVRETEKRTTNSKPIPHIPLPFKEVMADVLKVKPPEKQQKSRRRKAGMTSQFLATSWEAIRPSLWGAYRTNQHPV